MDEHARRIGREVAMCDETIPVPIDPTNVKDVSEYDPVCEECKEKLAGWKKFLNAPVTFLGTDEHLEG